MEKGNIIVIAGPTGSGESEITKRILQKFPQFQRVVTATSRAPRPREKEGIDYYFFSKEEFEKKIQENGFFEHIFVPNINTYYGTLKKPIEDKLNQGINLIANLERVGTEHFKKFFSGKVISIFIEPETLDVLRQRFLKRDPNIALSEVEERVKNAKEELKDAPYYDYQVVNKEGQIDQTVEEVAQLIQKFLDSRGE